MNVQETIIMVLFFLFFLAGREGTHILYKYSVDRVSLMVVGIKNQNTATPGTPCPIMVNCPFLDTTVQKGQNRQVKMQFQKTLLHSQI